MSTKPGLVSLVLDERTLMATSMCNLALSRRLLGERMDVLARF